MKQLEVLQSQLLPLKKLKPNTGQIPGLPANPRRITDIQLARLKRSIQQNPEMLSIKEMMVYAYNGEYIVIDGNQRLTVLKETQYKEVPCKVIHANSTPEQLRAYLIKSDLQFGSWVDDMLSKDWDGKELDDFGMDGVDGLFSSDSDIPVEIVSDQKTPLQSKDVKSDVGENEKPEQKEPVVIPVEHNEDEPEVETGSKEQSSNNTSNEDTEPLVQQSPEPVVHKDEQPTAPASQESQPKVKYSSRIQIPKYEPTCEEISVSDLYDTSKTEELIAEINASDIPQDIKAFLVESAYRHTVFNYKRIGDYYASAPVKIQELMERSVLVMIDIEDLAAMGLAFISDEKLTNLFVSAKTV